jgi:hypothetical protein
MVCAKIRREPLFVQQPPLGIALFPTRAWGQNFYTTLKHSFWHTLVSVEMPRIPAFMGPLLAAPILLRLHFEALSVTNCKQQVLTFLLQKRTFCCCLL